MAPWQGFLKNLKLATNPIANMISIPFQFNFGMTDYDRYGTVLNMDSIKKIISHLGYCILVLVAIPIMRR